MNTMPLLPHVLAGRWQEGHGHASTLHDPVLGTPWVRVSSAGLDLAEGFPFAREQGGALGVIPRKRHQRPGQAGSPVV